MDKWESPPKCCYQSFNDYTTIIVIEKSSTRNYKVKDHTESLKKMLKYRKKLSLMVLLEKYAASFNLN